MIILLNNSLIQHKLFLLGINKSSLFTKRFFPKSPVPGGGDDKGKGKKIVEFFKSKFFTPKDEDSSLSLTPQSSTAVLAKKERSCQPNDSGNKDDKEPTKQVKLDGKVDFKSIASIKIQEKLAYDFNKIKLTILDKVITEALEKNDLFLLFKIE